MKKCSTPPVLWKMQIETSLRFLLLQKWLSSRKTNNKYFSSRCAWNMFFWLKPWKCGNIRNIYSSISHCWPRCAPHVLIFLNIRKLKCEQWVMAPPLLSGRSLTCCEAHPAVNSGVWLLCAIIQISKFENMNINCSELGLQHNSVCSLNSLINDRKILFKI